MANGHGGARPGAGRKKKPLSEKILDGTTDKHRPKVLDFEGAAVPPDPPEWTAYYGTKTAGQPDVGEIYRTTVEWLKKTGCLHLINPEYITDYAIIKASWYEAQRMITKYGLTYVRGSETEKKVLQYNPIIDAVAKYHKMTELAWAKIWNIVAQNSEIYFGDDPNRDSTSYLLNHKPER